MAKKQSSISYSILPQSSLSDWAIFKRNNSARFGLLILVIIFTLTLFSSIISEDPGLRDTGAHLVPPSWQENGTPDHLLGTDMLGRDLFSRLLNGSYLTIGTASLSVLIALLLGIALGIFSATLRGNAQLLVMRIVDIILAIPSLILAIIIVAILGSGLLNASIAVSLVLLPNFVRLTNSYVIEEMSKPYVAAARLDGAKSGRILLKIIFPNVAASLVIQTTLSLSTAIVDIAALGFLGLGAQPPLPEWGSMLFEARTSMYLAPWSVAIPGFAIFVTVFCINLVGDGLNSAINSKSRT